MLRKLIRACVLAALTAAPALADTYMLQSRMTGALVGVDGAGLLAANAGSEDALVLDMIWLEAHRVALRDPRTGRFLRAGVGQQTYLMVASPHIRGWETFEIRRRGPNVTLMSVQNGQFVGIGDDQRLRAAWPAPGARSEFLLIRAEAQAQAPQAAHPPQSDLPFAGSWVLDALFENGRPVSLNDRAVRRAHMRLERRGAVSGSTGCNSYTADLMERGSVYVLQNFVLTRRLCHGVQGEVARLFRNALGDVAHFGLVGPSRLELRDHNGRLRARFVRG